MLTDAQIALLEELTTEIIKTTHKSLNNEVNGRKRMFTLKFYAIKNHAYFFESNFTVSRFLFGTPQYRIGVNPIIFEYNISRSALKGILAHELVHSEHFYNGTSIGTIIPVGIKMLRKKSRVQYERRTDMQVLNYGYGEQLKAYRLFQYALLTNNDLSKKKEEYLTPEEIKYLDSIRKKHPKLLEMWLSGEEIPIGLAGFEQSVKDYENIQSRVHD